jgi:hypothetical protein
MPAFSIQELLLSDYPILLVKQGLAPDESPPQLDFRAFMLCELALVARCASFREFPIG